MRIARWLLLAVAMMCLCASSLAAEGDPLLKVDDLLTLQASYERFLNDLADLLIERELLSSDDREAWLDMQMGDYISNGGYGSIMTLFYPGVLEYAEEEEQLVEVKGEIEGGTMSLLTMRRYSPGDAGTYGLMLLPEAMDNDNRPISASFELSASDGVFYRWDPVADSYVSVGVSVVTEGETVFWSCYAPMEGALEPRITFDISTENGTVQLGRLVLQMDIVNGGYRIGDAFLSE